MPDETKRRLIMAMEEGMGYNGWGIVIFLIILFAVFWGGFGNRGNSNGCEGSAFENYKAIMDAKVSEITNTATTQYNVERQAAATRELVTALNNATNTKIDFYGFQNERDKNAQLQRENMELRNQLFVKDQLAPINSQLADIRCRMLPKPDISGVGVSCPNAGILNGLGFNGFNNCNRGCGCSGVTI